MSHTCMCARMRECACAHVYACVRMSIRRVLTPYSRIIYIRVYSPTFLSCGTIFTFLCAQVTWHHVEHLIAALKKDRQSPLKAGDMSHFFLSANHFKNDLISTIDLRSYNGSD